MPTFSFSFSFHRPRFLRSNSSRSRTPNPSPSRPRNDAAAPSSPPSSLAVDESQASFSRPPYILYVPERGGNTTSTGTSYPPTLRSFVNHHLIPTDDMLDNLGGQPSPALSAGTPKSTVPSSIVHIPNPHGSATEEFILSTSPSNNVDSFQAPHFLAPLPTPNLPTSLQCSLNYQQPSEPSRQYSPKSQHRNHGMFHEAHDLTVTGTFIDVGDVSINTSSQFMEKLLEQTILGAEFDSSDRDPPPRCHPGTRLAILERCLYFIHHCDGERKIRWVVGAAGVGKSAVMQSVAESPELPVGYHASVFFSINGRTDGTKTVLTISYQFAAKSQLYRQVIEKAITRDPSLLRSSMAKQFLKFIIEPFIHHPQLNSPGRVLIIIDGLDECRNSRTQVELLRLISDFCITYPSSPLVWLIASRPETHITSFFASAEVKPSYEKEEIVIDSDEARADVERFLRNELMKIKEQASDSLDPQWPEERHIWKLANASGGLFAHAQTVIRYIGDSRIGSPASQLSDVLNVIDNHPLTGISPEEHPMALLDALYARILSNVPPRIWTNTRKLLSALTSNRDWDRSITGNFNFLCNWLGMTPDEAYAALNHLRSVLDVPRRNEAHKQKLKAFHKSFIDYIRDSSRSGFSPDIDRETQQLINECTSRILREAPDGIDFGDADYGMDEGRLAPGPGTTDNISLSWPVHQGINSNDDEIKLMAYKLAIGEVIDGLKREDSTFHNMFYMRLLTNRFQSYTSRFPHHPFSDVVFDESRRHNSMMDGVLKLMPLNELDTSQINYGIKLQFRRSATVDTNLSDPWNSSCKHVWRGKWERGKEQNRTTVFLAFGTCFCSERFNRQLKAQKVQFPDYRVPFLFTSAGECCVEFRFVDPEDGMSEWTYRFWIELTAEKRKKYESTM